MRLFSKEKGLDDRTLSHSIQNSFVALVVEDKNLVELTL